MAKRAKKERKKTVKIFLDFLFATAGIAVGLGVGLIVFAILCGITKAIIKALEEMME